MGRRFSGSALVLRSQTALKMVGSGPGSARFVAGTSGIGPGTARKLQGRDGRLCRPGGRQRSARKASFWRRRGHQRLPATCSTLRRACRSHRRLSVDMTMRLYPTSFQVGLRMLFKKMPRPRSGGHFARTLCGNRLAFSQARRFPGLRSCWFSKRPSFRLSPCPATSARRATISPERSSN